MSDKICEFRKFCDCKVETFVCDNSSDFNAPHYTAEYSQTVYQRQICKYEK